MLPALLPTLAARRRLSRQGLLTRSAAVRLACWLLCLCLQPPAQAQDGSKDISAVDPPTQHQALPADLDLRARDYPEPDGYSLPSTPELGAIGVQLQGDSRFLLRVRRGGPMLYYRAKF